MLSRIKQKRKLWADEIKLSMVGVVKSVEEGKGLREAVRLYNVSVETRTEKINKGYHL